MFDSLNELIEKIALGEDSTIEFKREIPHKKSLADEITAFANVKGGVILIGVDDNSDIVGIDIKNLNQYEKIIIEVCRDSIEPPVNIFTEKLTVENKNILKIDVPYSFFVHKSSNGYFIRQGSSKREMSTEHLARLLQSRSQARIIPFDEQLVPNTHYETFEKSLYQRFIPNEVSDDETNNFLLKRHLLIEERDYYRVTVAGLLMCSQHSDKYLYNSFICAVCYSGTTRDANYQIDAQDFKGALDQQIVDAFAFVKKHNQVSALKNIGRIDQPQYSMKAVFEAIVNAVIHRDYSKHGSKIRLFIFKDRLELYSPGALANSLTVENLRYNQMSRNELLGRLLSELSLDDNIAGQIGRKHFLERRGEGVGIILKESFKLSNKKPIYEVLGEELQLIIFAARSLQEK